MNQQQIGELLSNMIIDIFLLDTTVSRIEQVRHRSRYKDLLIHIGKVITTEKTHQIIIGAHRILICLLAGEKLEAALQELDRLKGPIPLRNNIFQLKRLIAEAGYRLQEYPF
jgi:hypothetical protein